MPPGISFTFWQEEGEEAKAEKQKRLCQPNGKQMPSLD